MAQLRTLFQSMELDLGPLVDAENLSIDTQLGEPVVNLNGTAATVPMGILAGGVSVRSGSVTVGCGVGGGSSNLVMVLYNGEAAGSGLARSWTLTQTSTAWAGAITMWGDMTIVDETLGTTTLIGGWSWSQASGPQINPSSDPGFQGAVAEMLYLSTTGGSVAATIPDLGTILAVIGNLTKLGINYILDWFIPYTAPTSCTGPIIEDGAGESCENASLLCKNDLADLCLGIDDIPGVPTSFKKCMKGRCGCGGSNHKRLRVQCADTANCGACESAGGCSLVGDEAWYCQPDGVDACAVCAETIFHEMSHACGSPDDPNCQRPTSCENLPDPESFQGSCKTGFSFADQCCFSPPGN